MKKLYRGRFLGISLKTISQIMGVSPYLAKKYLDKLPEGYTYEEIGDCIYQAKVDKQLRSLSKYLDM